MGDPCDEMAASVVLVLRARPSRVTQLGYENWGVTPIFILSHLRSLSGTPHLGNMEKGLLFVDAVVVWFASH